MSHGFPRLPRRLLSPATLFSRPATTNIRGGTGGRATYFPGVYGPLRSPIGSVKAFPKRHKTEPGEPYSQSTSQPLQTSLSSSSSWSPSEHFLSSAQGKKDWGPPLAGPSHSRQNQTWSPPSARENPSNSKYGDARVVPTWLNDEQHEDVGPRLRKLVYDLGLGFPYQMQLMKTRRKRLGPKDPGLKVSVSKLQLIHPWSMRFFLPWGHAFEELTLRRYAEKRKEPLWSFAIMYEDGGGPERGAFVRGAFVRSKMTARVERAWKVALRRQGFDPQGRPLGEASESLRTKPLKGTVKFTGQAKHVLNMTVDEIADWMERLVDQVVRELDDGDD